MLDLALICFEFRVSHKVSPRGAALEVVPCCVDPKYVLILGFARLLMLCVAFWMNVWCGFV